MDETLKSRGARAAGLGPRCPRCKSTKVLTRTPNGLRERLAILFTGERKYRCELCDCRFRAPDRRRETRREF